MRRKFTIGLVTVALSAIGFIVAYDTVCVLLRDNPAELSVVPEQEEGTSKPEKEKEKESDEMNEMFMESFFFSLSRPVLSLNYSCPFPGHRNYLSDFVSEIIPPPPRF